MPSLGNLASTQGAGLAIGLLLAAKLTRGTNIPVMLVGGGVGYVAGGKL